MKILVVIFNIILFLFTLFVLATDGFPKQVGYILATLLVLLTPILSLAVIFLNRAGNGGVSSITNILKIAAIICNIALIGYTCWAMMLPHPEEGGYIPFIIISLLTPILNLVMFLFFVAPNQKTNPT